MPFNYIFLLIALLLDYILDLINFVIVTIFYLKFKSNIN